MPQVPYSPVPTVAPSGQALPKPAVNSPLEAFGGATGAALGKLGAAVEGAGDELFKRGLALQQLNNESEAKEADARYMIKSGKLHADYSALEGKAAFNGLKAHNENLNKLRLDIRDGLANEMSRKMYDSNSLSTMGRNIFNAAGHAATENKKYVAGASVARIASSADQVMQNPSDEGAFNDGLRTIENEIRGTQSQLEGWSPEKTEQEVTKNRSHLLSVRIEGMARSQPWTAKAYLDKNRAGMTASDIARADKLVETQTRGAGSRVIADEVDQKFTAEDGKLIGSLEERIDYAKGLAEKRAPDDPLMKDFATQRVIANFNQQKTVKRDFDLDNINTVNGALIGGTTKDGKLPTTLEELKADPKVAQAYDALDTTKQRAVIASLTKNSRGDQAWTQESQARLLQLKGLAQADPREFMGVDVANEKLPFSAKRELINQQIRLKDKAEGDPRVTHALQVLRPMTQAAGLDSTKDKDQYYQFVGSLQDAMDQFQQENKKLPNAEEINLMGSRLLQQKHSDQFTLPWSKDYTFALPVPEGAKNRIKNDPFWAERGTTPTDQDIQRIYTREQYQGLYGGKTKAEAKPKVPSK